MNHFTNFHMWAEFDCFVLKCVLVKVINQNIKCHVRINNDNILKLCYNQKYNNWWIFYYNQLRNENNPSHYFLTRSYKHYSEGHRNLSEAVPLQKYKRKPIVPGLGSLHLHDNHYHWQSASCDALHRTNDICNLGELMAPQYTKNQQETYAHDNSFEKTCPE